MTLRARAYHMKRRLGWLVWRAVNWLDGHFGFDRPRCFRCGKRLGRAWKGVGSPRCADCVIADYLRMTQP